MIHLPSRPRRGATGAVLNRVFLTSDRKRRPTVVWSGGGSCPPPRPVLRSHTDRNRTPILPAAVGALGAVAAALVAGVFTLWPIAGPAQSPGSGTCERIVDPAAPPAVAGP
jgi:hypothetical protein